MIRRILGWSNPDGSARESQVEFSYSELMEGANISRGAIREAMDEALTARYIVCLRDPQRAQTGTFGQSAVFALNWDDSGDYIKDPDLFQGFYGANANRTNIPNVFFDYTVRNESLATIKVVGAIIRHTIAFEDHGFRRMHKELSFNDLLRITGLNSRTTLSKAIQTAIEGNHIVRLQQGVFGNGREAKSTYGLCWSDGGPNHPKNPPPPERADRPVQKVDQTNTRFSGGYANDDEARPKSGLMTSPKYGPRTSPRTGPDTKPKSGPGPVQKVDQNQSKNRTTIEITKNNTSKEQQQKWSSGGRNTDLNTDAAVVVFRATSLLKDEGFQDRDAIAIVQTKIQEIKSAIEANGDDDNHELLAATKAEELIRNQINWLPKRSVTKSKLGMLRAAIEGDFEHPEANQPKPDDAGFIFAKSYYAAYAGSGKFIEPFPRDPGLASQFLASLNIVDTTPEETGRSFGRFVRERHASDRNAKPFLSTAINMHGEGFSKLLQSRAAKKIQDQKEKDLKAHEKAFQNDYREYLVQKAKDLNNYPTLLREFEEEQEQQVAIMKKMGFDPKKFMSAEGRVEAIAEHFRNHKQFTVLSFWDWDQQFNPRGFGSKKNAPKAHQKTANA
jgi:hypothetical protein